MRSLFLRLTVESPLAIRADHAATGAAGAKSIPGSTLLGSLASLYRVLYADKPESEAFARLFLEEQVLYPALYPALFKDKKGLQDRNTPVSPLPVTALSCKRHPGFVYPEDDDGHGVRDTLFDRALCKIVTTSPPEALQTQTQPAKIFGKIFEQQKQCYCGEAMDHFDGYYRRNDLSPYQYIAAQSITRLQTHTGIHRQSGTVQDGILYSRQVFAEGMEFWGEIRLPGDETLFAPLKAFLKDFETPGLLRMGTGRTRGMGKVKLSVDEPVKQRQFGTFTERLAAFNQALQARAAEFGLDTLPYAYFFALTLHSPMLLCDDLLRYQSCIDAATLQGLLPSCSLPGLTLVYYASSLRRITGWQELWGTPRTGEYAIDSGSVFLFACSSPPDEECLRALFALEAEGIGKRRAEGFGRVQISDEFHQLVKQEA